MNNLTNHRNSFARFVFHYFFKKYGDGHLHHEIIRNKIDFIGATINFNSVTLRLCMYMQDDFSTYFTVFEDNKVNNLSRGIILAITSCVSFQEDRVTVKSELQYLYNDALPEEGFVKEVQKLFDKQTKSMDGWPQTELPLLKVA